MTLENQSTPNPCSCRESFPRLPGAPVESWSGHRDWRGRALPPFLHFDFHALPWTTLVKRNRERDGVMLVKRGGGSRMVFRVANPRRFGADWDGPVYVKRYLIDTARRRVGNLLSGGKAGREFRGGWKVIGLGLRTAESGAWAVCRKRSLFMPARGALAPAAFLLTLEAPNEGSVLEWAKSGRAVETKGFLRGLAQYLAIMHERGFDHDDCSAENLLVAPGAVFGGGGEDEALERFVLIDIDHGRFERGGVAPGRRGTDLAQMVRSLLKTCLAHKADREKFIENYIEMAGMSAPARRALKAGMERYLASRVK